jgi:hypothetical protein
VLVHYVGDGVRAARQRDQELDPMFAANEGLLADVLQVPPKGSCCASVPANGRLGEPGSPEHLARHQILGVPVTYGAGDKRVVLGALLLIDKRGTTYSTENQLGSEEGQVAESFAAMLGFGARRPQDGSARQGTEHGAGDPAADSARTRRPACGLRHRRGLPACGAVGGDYFDYVPLADGRTLVVIADVSGHNLASGMMMVSARAMLRTLAVVHHEPAQVFEDVGVAMFGT